jgi:3-hydroxybutyryl-CoA dehydrogenase
MGVGRMVVVGGGTMGLGIAYTATNVGYTIQVVEVDADRRENAVTRIGQLWDAAVARGKLTADQVAEAWTRFTVVPSLEQIETGADLIVEAVPERLDLKRDVLAAAEAREPVLLATNTSSIAIAELARDLRAPDRFVGLHFFNPVWAMALVEVVVGPRTSDQTVADVLGVVTALGKDPVVVRDAPGCATSRLGVMLGLEAIRMVADGVASPADIDKAMVLGYKHPVGPLELTDIVGLDVRLDIARTLQAAYGDRFAPPQLLVQKVAAGELGKKSGHGFYRWVDGQRQEV